MTVTGTAMLGSGAVLNASLTLADGATLDMMSLDAGALSSRELSPVQALPLLLL